MKIRLFRLFVVYLSFISFYFYVKPCLIHATEDAVKVKILPNTSLKKAIISSCVKKTAHLCIETRYSSNSVDPTPYVLGPAQEDCERSKNSVFHKGIACDVSLAVGFCPKEQSYVSGQMRYTLTIMEVYYSPLTESFALDFCTQDPESKFIKTYPKID